MALGARSNPHALPSTIVLCCHHTVVMPSIAPTTKITRLEKEKKPGGMKEEEKERDKPYE